MEEFLKKYEKKVNILSSPQYLHNLLCGQPSKSDRIKPLLLIDLRSTFSSFDTEHIEWSIHLDLSKFKIDPEETYRDSLQRIEKTCLQLPIFYSRFRWRKISKICLLLPNPFDNADKKIDFFVSLLLQEKLVPVNICSFTFDEFSSVFPYLITSSYHNDINTKWPSLISETENRVYLGCIRSTYPSIISKLKIKYILNCSEKVCNNDKIAIDKVLGKIKYLELGLVDDLNENLSEKFDTAFEFIKKSIKDKKNILIHCLAGVSRSVSIVCAFLMKSNNWSYEKTIEYIQKHREVAKPNPGFIKQLQEYEKELKK